MRRRIRFDGMLSTRRFGTEAYLLGHVLADVRREGVGDLVGVKAEWREEDVEGMILGVDCAGSIGERELDLVMRFIDGWSLLSSALRLRDDLLLESFVLGVSEAVGAVEAVVVADE